MYTGFLFPRKLVFLFFTKNGNVGYSSDIKTMYLNDVTIVTDSKYTDFFFRGKLVVYTNISPIRRKICSCYEV